MRNPYKHVTVVRLGGCKACVLGPSVCRSLFIKHSSLNMLILFIQSTLKHHCVPGTVLGLGNSSKEDLVPALMESHSGGGM